MKLLKNLFVAAIVLAAAPAAMAHTTMYSATLTGAAEAPPNASTATGTVLVTFDFDLVTMRVQASFTGLSGNTTAAHIHSATAIPFSGTAGVATQTPSFTGFPLGVTGGSMDTTYDMTLASSYNAAFITNNGGTVSTAMNALVNALDTGRAYFNVHTSTFGGGEIRGFLSPIPEPGSALLAGFVGAGFFLRRRR